MNWKEKLETKSEDLLGQYQALWGELAATEGMADDKYEQWKKDVAAISAEREMIDTEIKDKEALRVVLLAKKHRLQAATQWAWEDMENGAISDNESFDKWTEERTMIQMELAKTIDQLKGIEELGLPVAEIKGEEAQDSSDQEMQKAA